MRGLAAVRQGNRPGAAQVDPLQLVGARAARGDDQALAASREDDRVLDHLRRSQYLSRDGRDRWGGCPSAGLPEREADDAQHEDGEQRHPPPDGRERRRSRRSEAQDGARFRHVGRALPGIAGKEVPDALLQARALERGDRLFEPSHHVGHRHRLARRDERQVAAAQPGRSSPTAYRSARSSGVSPFSCSGAMYAGVPVHLPGR